jgi:hypothetical protein
LPGNYDGGSDVIDYRVSFKEVIAQDYQIFAAGILTTSITVTGLTPGVIYLFRVESRNIVNFSSYSVPITELAAQIPD